MNEWIMVVPNIPEKLGIRLRAKGYDRFEMVGGPMSGQLIQFTKLAMIIGKSKAPRISGPVPGPVYMVMPEIQKDDQRDAAYEQLCQDISSGLITGAIDYKLPYPKVEFLRYLAGKFLFHGTNKGGIETFRPIRRSFQTGELDGEGNLAAVYATHDAIWATYFGILDKRKLVGRNANGMFFVQDAEGKAVPAYRFSLDRGVLRTQPWTTGWIYLLPNDGFKQLKVNGMMSNEWGCTQDVIPLARLQVDPADFPFLDQVGAHDDAPLMRLGRLSNELLPHILTHRPIANGFEIVLDWNDKIEVEVLNFIKLQRKFMPAADFALIFTRDQGEVLLKITSPEAYQQVVEAWLNTRCVR